MTPDAVIFDLDNTLAESKQPITGEMGKQLAILSSKSIIAIISGGKLEQLQLQVIDELPPTAVLTNFYLLPTSGGALYTYHDNSWVRMYEEILSEKEVHHIEAVIESVCLKTGLVDFGKSSHGDLIEYRGSQVTLSALGQNAPLDKKKAWDPDRSKRETLSAEIQKLLPAYSVKVGGTTSIDVTKKGINKAYGIGQLSREIKIPVEHMVYVGDELGKGGNDEVVKRTGITTYAVQSPLDTAVLISDLLSKPSEEESVASQIAAPQSSLVIQLKSELSGDVTTNIDERNKYSRDTSLFLRTPSVVIYPKNSADVSAMVKAVHDAKRKGENVSITGRSAGTDMSGGPLTTSLVAVFMKYMNKIIEVGDGYAVTEPGVFYRDFEKATLAKNNQILPSYPASRELCAMGGIVNNDSGGERTLEYGKTDQYIQEVEAVLSDGSLVTFKELTKEELEAKKAQHDFEGDIYRKIDALLANNKELIANAKPKVSKNSAGYMLWNIVDKEKGTFNLSRLICGAQGTLSLMTKAKLRLIKEETHRSMLVIFLNSIDHLPEIVHKVLPFNPESFESYDDQTFKLAIRFLFPMLSQMGLGRATRLGFSFLPEVGMVMVGGIPKLVLMAEFSDDTAAGALKKAKDAKAALAGMGLSMSLKKNERSSEKYWIVRRESFALLRKNVHGLYASPFIDDFVVPPDTYPQFLPELNALLAEYDKYFIYTIAGHIGNGNFHIIPLMDLNKPETRKVVLELAPKVYELVIKYGGTTTGEHNDGIIRTPYLPMLFGDKVVKLFEETKTIFDPLNIFNPGKKVHGTFKDIEHDMLKSS
jgi:HAD superfamily hydrolase (TIGR01484 family)